MASSFENSQVVIDQTTNFRPKQFVLTTFNKETKEVKANCPCGLPMIIKGRTYTCQNDIICNFEVDQDSFIFFVQEKYIAMNGTREARMENGAVHQVETQTINWPVCKTCARHYADSNVKNKPKFTLKTFSKNEHKAYSSYMQLVYQCGCENNKLCTVAKQLANEIATYGQGWNKGVVDEKSTGTKAAAEGKPIIRYQPLFE